MWTRIETGDFEIDMVNFWLTSYCNLACPDCCVNVPNYKNPEHFSIDYIRESARYFEGIYHLRITGGEATMHPDFMKIVPELREWFKCSLLTLATNGYKVIEYSDILCHFDDVLCSLYPNNRKEVEFLRKNNFFKANDRAATPQEHIPMRRRAEKSRPCNRANEAVAFVNGLLYPCCIAPDFLGCTGIPLTENWKEEILSVPIPCENCIFALEMGQKVKL